MEREAAIVEFFRARLDEEAADLDRLTSGPLVQGYLRVYGDRLKANIEADRRLLERYDYCVAMECPGNVDLSYARREYETEVFPARIARFADHPAYATLQGPWVPEDYANAVKSESAPYRTCRECSRVYPTAADLMAEHVALVARINAETSPDNPPMVAQTDLQKIYVCPACAHDF
ncbi:hypothetical protein ACIBQX_11440 [Nonomuraea sp. NPDC049714]|uniref:hypothetical protein n=1 Tax=Nonomuraea sp. NPDC049714 TaxID=3364357 RepID=UPI00379E5DB1